MYMTYDIVGPYRIRHRKYVRCRMSTYDSVCQTYDVVRLLEVAVPAVLKEPDPLPTALANELCLSHSKSFFFKPHNKQDSVRNTVFVVFSHPKTWLWLRSTGITS
jgi:hypothetical protein